VTLEPRGCPSEGAVEGTVEGVVEGVVENGANAPPVRGILAPRSVRAGEGARGDQEV